MPEGVTDGVGLPMLPHHVLLEFHKVFGSLSSLFQLVQGHVALQSKGTPRLLKEMRLEHMNDAPVHQLQESRGVWQQED